MDGVGDDRQHEASGFAAGAAEHVFGDVDGNHLTGSSGERRAAGDAGASTDIQHSGPRHGERRSGEHRLGQPAVDASGPRAQACADRLYARRIASAVESSVFTRTSGPHEVDRIRAPARTAGSQTCSSTRLSVPRSARTASASRSNSSSVIPG